MAYSSEIASRIKAYLTGDDWKYDFDSEEGMFNFGLRLKGKLQSVKYKVRVNNDGYTVYLYCPLSAEECLQEMAEFVCRANYGLRNGNFELDFRDGEVRYKSYVDCDGQLPSSAVVRDSILVPAAMFRKYGDGLVAVIFGAKSAKDAVADCESD